MQSHLYDGRFWGIRRKGFKLVTGEVESKVVKDERKQDFRSVILKSTHIRITCRCLVKMWSPQSHCKPSAQETLDDLNLYVKQLI